MPDGTANEGESARLPDFGGRYQEVTPLAERDLTRTFRALDPRRGQHVFLKMLRDAKRDDAIARQLFFDEPALLRTISSQAPNIPIVPLLDLGEHRGLPYFAQPFLDGASLDRFMRQPFNGPITLAIIEGCLEFLASLDGVGITHGDISPDNIFIEADIALAYSENVPEHFRVRLLDFNSATRVERSDTQARGVLFLKLPYAAPELARGEAPSPLSDLYALGVVFYEMLAGRRPHEPTTMADVRALRNADVPPVPLNCEVPQLVEDLARSFLATDPAGRPANATEALRRLRALKSLHRWLGETTPAAWLQPGAGTGKRSDYRVPPGVGVQPPARVITGLTPAPTAYRPPAPAAAWEADDPVPTTPREVPISSGAPATGRSVSESREAISMIQAVPVPTTQEGIDLVDFAMFGPASVPPGRAFVLEVWAHVKAQREEVLGRATRHGRLIERGSRGPVRVPSGTEVTLLVHLAGFEVKDPQDSFFWTGEIANIGFIVTAPPDVAAGVHPGQVSILHAGMLLARLIFDVAVGESINQTASIGVAQRFTSAFASYATQDRDEVLRRVQGLSAAGVDVFLDVLSLRAGQDWEQQLIKNIRARDVFYLFWSLAASRSEWVAREWRYALQEKALDYIQPIPLVDPRLAPPPPELASKHFNDLILACLVSQKLASGDAT